MIDFTPELRKEALAVLAKVQLRPAVHAAVACRSPRS